MFLPRVGRRVEPFESLAPPDGADLERLEELRAAGSKLELPHPVRAFVSFAAESDARAAMEAIEQHGFRTRLHAEADGSWTVTAIYTLVPTPGGITKIRELLASASELHGGRYLGWQAPPIY